MKKVLKSVSICYIIAAMLTAGAFAAAPADPIQPQASKYIFQTTTAVVALSGGELEFDLDIAATGKMKDVGVLQINIYEVGVSDPVASHYYTDPGYEDMMGHNTISHTAEVFYTGKPGRQYYASVRFYAGENGVAGGVHVMGTAIVTAKK